MLDSHSSQLVLDFVAWGVKLQAYSEMETVYRTNLVLAEIGLDGIVDGQTGNTERSLSELTTLLLDISDKSPDERWQLDVMRARLLNIVTPTPDRLQSNFEKLYAQSPEKAVAYYYDLSRAVENVKVADIQKNIAYEATSDFGDLEITINLSKPEKTTAEIKAAAAAPKAAYPPTALDYTNEGYAGSITQAPRATHRFIRESLQGQTWGWHYSPYAYFGEHAIFVDFERETMVINQATFENLLTIVERYPMYFVGSNADLPIVGGSILSQEHFQGGRHVFPLMKAPTECEIPMPAFPDIRADIVRWPMTTIRLTATDKEKLVAASEFIREAWQGYSDDRLDIHATSERGEQQHTVTPIAMKRPGLYVMYLVLRDNGTSAEYPEGIFHPHPDVQHIKRENIGLIEVMGLAILPARLKDELGDVEAFLLGEVDINQVAEGHRPWAEMLAHEHTVTPDNVHQIVQQAVGQVFAEVLTHAGVYKYDASGHEGLKRFIAHLTAAGK